MDQQCWSTINIGNYSQIRLKLTSSFKYVASFRCQVIIKAKFGAKMMFNFRDLSMEDNCDNDWLEIDDGSSRSDPYLAGN